MDKVIQIKDLILDTRLDISHLEIKRGERICLYGDNGSSKSTLCHLIAGIIYPDKGSLLINNKKIEDYNICPVVMIMQNPHNQILKNRVENDVAFALENKNIKREEMQKKVDKALEFFQIKYLKKRNTNTLSAGETQKLLFCSTSIIDEEIYIFDEPLAMIDDDSKEIFLSYLDYLRGKTIIIVSHIKQDAFNCDRFIELDKGRIKSTNKPKEIEFFEKKLPIIKDEILLKISNLSYKYEDRIILNDINLDIKKGEIIGLVGKSGSGKTTLLKLIIGLLKTKNIKRNCNISFALQNPLDQISYANSLDEIAIWFKKQSKSEEEALFLLDYLKIPNTSVFNLSLGELRLVSIASALASKASLLVMDEITAHLDQKSIKRVFDLIYTSSSTLIMASHDINVLKRYCSRIIEIQDGYVRSI